jgi:hypothetical protein
MNNNSGMNRRDFIKLSGLSLVGLMVLEALPGCRATNTSITSATGLTQDEASQGVKYIYEVEKVARDAYLNFYDKWGTPVQNVISASEQNHMDIMKEIIDQYSLGDPAKGRGHGEFSTGDLQKLYSDLINSGYSSEVDALSTSAMIEEFDIVEIKKHTANLNKTDFLAAYGKLMTGSENHLEIFTAKLKEKGVQYKPVYLSQQDYDKIIAAGTIGTTTTTATTTGTSKATFGSLAVNGGKIYNSSCINCHGESLSTLASSSATLAKNQNAQKLLERIAGMPISGEQQQWEVLSYLLLEHEWVSGNTVFNLDILSQISLSQ